MPSPTGQRKSAELRRITIASKKLHVPWPAWDFKLLAMDQKDAPDPEAWAQHRRLYDWHSALKMSALDYLCDVLPKRFPRRNHRRLQAQLAIKRHRAAVLLRDGYVCGICGGEIAEHEVSIDHIMPISLGGSDDPNNLQPAHRRCNSQKGNRVAEMEGWLADA